VGRGGRREQ